MVFRATLSNKVNFNPLESFPYLTLIHPRVQIDYRYLNYHMIPSNDRFTVKSQSNSYISPKIKLRFYQTIYSEIQMNFFSLSILE